MPNEVTEKVRLALNEPITKLGFEIVDVELATRYGQPNLTVVIDIPRGVTLDDCETVHNEISPLLDELDPIPVPYVLNVSSPGLDRPFKTQRDFERNYGKEVEIKLYAPLLGKKVYEGKLIEKTENVVKISSDDGKEIKLEMTRVAYVRPLVKFE